MSNVEQTFDNAVRFHQAGDLQRAEQLYRQVLTDDARHADALHHLGLLRRQQGNPDQAVEFIRQALQVRPNLVEAHYNLGNALSQLGRLEEAAAEYKEAVRLRPSYLEAHNNLGNVLKRLGRLEEAAASYRAAVRLRPDQAGAHYNLGNTLFELGQPAEAEISLRQALGLQPEFADALSALGNALLALGRADEAEISLREAIRLAPDSAEAHSNLANVQREQGKLEDAIASCRTAILLDPASAAAHNSLGSVFEKQEKQEAAMASYRTAILLNPSFAEAHNNLANVLKEQRKLDEAIASYRRAIRFKAFIPEMHFNLGMTLLLRGDLRPGWAEYEWRWQTKGWPAPASAPPLWDGSLLAGRTILLGAEQGLGDTIQFVRYAPLVKSCGGIVVLGCQAALTRLLARAPGIERLAAWKGPAPVADVYAPLLSLPHLLGTSGTGMPADVPYLTPEPDLVEDWKRKLGPPSAGLRVGIVWQGNPKHGKDRDRSVPLLRFAPLAGLEGVRLVSLQKEFGTEQLARVADLFPVTDLAPDLKDFVDTAAALANLDLVVTVDTAVAHLAGALGVPVWVALPFLPDWRWQLDREDSPWYPTMRLFRQETPGDWPGVFERITAALRDFDLPAQ